VRPFLAFDGSTDHVALALGDLDAPETLLAADDFTAPRAANTALLPAAERLLARGGLVPSALHAVAVGRGPGSFTGVRIAVAAAKGLAHGARIPLAGFGTLDAVAWRVRQGGLLGILGDAMRGEVYPALFRARAGSVERLAADRVALPADVAREWAGHTERILLAGPGLHKHRKVFEEALGERAVLADESLWVPDGRGVLAAAWADRGDLSVSAIAGLSADDAYRLAHPQRLLPVYTRLSDAEEAERLRLGGASEVPDAGVAGPEDRR